MQEDLGFEVSICYMLQSYTPTRPPPKPQQDESVFVSGFHAHFFG
jgi:hypothetical protein